MLDRFFRMGLGFVLSILIARHYGPEEWGMLSYVLASATLFGIVATGGMEEIILRDLSQANHPQAVADIQKTTFILRLIYGGIAFFALVLFIALTQGTDLLLWMAIIYGALFIFQASEIWEYRLRIEGQVSVVAKTHMVTSILSNVLKGICLVWSLPLTYLTAAMSSEYLANLGALASYKARHWRQWVGQFDSAYAKKLLASSFLVMLSGFLMACQARSEFYLVDYFLGIEAVGIYAAAFKCMELFDILVVIFSMTLVPELAKRESADLQAFASRIYLLGFLFFGAMLIPFAVIYVLFPWLFGAQYEAGQALLPWLAMKPLFLILGSIRSIFLVLEGRFRYVPVCASVGFIASLGFGSFLIPEFGLVGAAMTGVISLCISNLVMDAIFQRRNLRWMADAFGQWPYIAHTFRRLWH